MQTITPHPIRSRIKQIRYFLRRRKRRQKIAEERGIIPAGGFEEELAGGCTLITGYVSHVREWVHI